MEKITRWFLGPWTLLKLFTLVSFAIILAGTAGIGWWVSDQIKKGVVSESATNTALYMDSFIAPNIQELNSSNSLTSEHITSLNKIFQETNFGRQIVSFKLWDANGRILFSETPSLIGLAFPSDPDVMASFSGNVTAEISDLTKAENITERRGYTRLLQIYSPIRLNGSNKIIAVAEFYETVDVLEAEIARAQRQSWILVGLIMLAIFLSLLGFARRADRIIRKQETDLASQVAQLKELLVRNEELNERVKRAAANATEMNERFLRRTSAELHDGPVQQLGLAFLRLDQVISQSEVCYANNTGSSCHQHLPEIQKSLERSMQEIRDISKGLGIPQLENMTLPEIVRRVVNSHERHTGTKVTLESQDLPEQATLPLKITIFRFIQEALNNAFHHARGIGQKVVLINENGNLKVTVSDEGAGFDPSQGIDWEDHLGLAGMRERVESLGGEFRIMSAINHGTTVTAHLALHVANSEAF